MCKLVSAEGFEGMYVGVKVEVVAFSHARTTSSSDSGFASRAKESPIAHAKDEESIRKCPKEIHACAKPLGCAAPLSLVLTLKNGSVGVIVGTCWYSLL